jgi:hypothetical protein
VQRKTSNGVELKLIEGGKSDFLPIRAVVRHHEVDMSLESIWKEMRIKTIFELVDSASMEMGAAFRSGISSVRGEIPKISDERLLRGDHHYISLKRSDPKMVVRSARIGAGAIDDFNVTISDTFKAAIKESFEEFMNELTAVNSAMGRQMPSSLANRMADMHMTLLHKEILSLKDEVLNKIGESKDAIDIKIAGNLLFSRSKRISGYIERETEKLREHGTSIVGLKPGIRI